jgi:hypothetical protein
MKIQKHQQNNLILLFESTPRGTLEKMTRAAVKFQWKKILLDFSENKIMFDPQECIDGFSDFLSNVFCSLMISNGKIIFLINFCWRYKFEEMKLNF